MVLISQCKPTPCGLNGNWAGCIQGPAHDTDHCLSPRHGGWGSQPRYLTHVTYDPRMIEVAAFPALLLQPRDKVTSPLGALWLQDFGERGGAGGRGAGLCWERCRNVSASFRPEDMLASHERSWAVTLSGLN